MNLEREALRLSAMIAFCIGAFVIMWSIDSFEQQTLPTLVGEAQCTWWSSTMQGCTSGTRSMSELTRTQSGISFSL